MLNITCIHYVHITCIHYVEYHIYSLCCISHVFIMLNITCIHYVAYHNESGHVHTNTREREREQTFLFQMCKHKYTISKLN